ncbi:MAG: hypothetical protein Q4F34_08575 [Prevotellaceae bacterium]|nr:hypothetical protein [Prevotellaceae bacterium]
MRRFLLLFAAATLCMLLPSQKAWADYYTDWLNTGEMTKVLHEPTADDLSFGMQIILRDKWGDTDGKGGDDTF